ncbi:hypothetical protein OG401_40445 [Kitasatospora purpeofusca]|nr:hypothetical protein [Kitasatospora purpeofusca]MCX4690494.1 hypothetical protein [Kitasatospora purpeofusca]
MAGGALDEDPAAGWAVELDRVVLPDVEGAVLVERDQLAQRLQVGGGAVAVTGCQDDDVDVFAVDAVGVDVPGDDVDRCVVGPAVDGEQLLARAQAVGAVSGPQGVEAVELRVDRVEEVRRHAVARHALRAQQGGAPRCGQTREVPYVAGEVPLVAERGVVQRQEAVPSGRPHQGGGQQVLVAEEPVHDLGAGLAPADDGDASAEGVGAPVHDLRGVQDPRPAGGDTARDVRPAAAAEHEVAGPGDAAGGVVDGQLLTIGADFGDLGTEGQLGHQVGGPAVVLLELLARGPAARSDQVPVETALFGEEVEEGEAGRRVDEGDQVLQRWHLEGGGREHRPVVPGEPAPAFEEPCGEGGLGIDEGGQSEIGGPDADADEVGPGRAVVVHCSGHDSRYPRGRFAIVHILADSPWK